MSGRWKTISPSQFPWEQDALDFVQRALPNREPFRAYSNFEFVADDGSINEVDLLIVSRYSIFIVEIKSRPGKSVATPTPGSGKTEHVNTLTTTPCCSRTARQRSSHRCCESN